MPSISDADERTNDMSEAAPAPKTILQEAYELVHGERQDDYGHPIEDFSRTAKMWSAIFGIDVEPWQIPMAMICVKLSRLSNDPTKRDSVTDIAGYAATLQMVMDKLAEIPLPPEETYDNDDDAARVAEI